MNLRLYRNAPIICLLLIAHIPTLLAGSLAYAEDLRQLSAEAGKRHLPIMLMVSQDHCGFCERMKSEVLQPMQLSGEYDDKVLMREIMIDPGETVINFQGRSETASSFIGHYKVGVTPTLLFLDPDGREVAERILGINTVDYLLFYIEDAIDQATRAMVSRIASYR